MASDEDVHQALKMGVDAVGFVCAEPESPRRVNLEQAAAMAAVVPPAVASFVLTSETTAVAITEQVRVVGAQVVQMVSLVDPEECVRLSERLPHMKMVQVIHVEDECALDLLESHSPHVHGFLLDSGRPSSAIPEYGGTGRTHDWAVSAEFVRRSSRPVFLAGGLQASNVKEAMKQVRPFGVDLCSGARTNGRLDVGKLAAFVEAVRQADDELRKRERTEA